MSSNRGKDTLHSDLYVPSFLWASIQAIWSMGVETLGEVDTVIISDGPGQFIG